MKRHFTADTQLQLATFPYATLIMFILFYIHRPHIPQEIFSECENYVLNLYSTSYSGPNCVIQKYSPTLHSRIKPS